MMFARVLAIVALVALPTAPVHADDFIAQLFKGASSGCDSGVASKLTEAIRSGIETEVKRAEAALKMPAGVSGLGCLDDLFAVNLDTMISLPNLQGLLKSAISNAETQVCSFAQEQWAKLTEPLTSALRIPSFENLGVPGFENSSTQIEFTTPTVGFGSQSTVPSYYKPEDLESGTTLRQDYNRFYGGSGQ